MTYFHLITLALKNVFNSHKKSRAAILSVASGFIALNLFQAYINDTNILFDQTYQNRSMLQHLLIRKENRLDMTNAQEQKSISSFLLRNADKIEHKTRFLYFSGLLNTGQIQTVFSGYGYDLEEGKKMRQPTWAWNVLAGVPLELSPDEIRGVSVGRRLAEIIKCQEKTRLDFKISKMGYQPEERGFHCENESIQLSVSTRSGQLNATNLKIIGIQDGIFSSIDQRLVVTSLPIAQSLVNTDDISMISLQLKDMNDLNFLKNDFSTSVQKEFPDLHLKSWKEYEIGDFYNKSVDFLNIFKYFISVVVIFIGALSVMTTFYRLVFERTREIGTLLSVGFRSKHVFILFLHEAFFLSVLGVLIGTLGSYLLAVVLNYPQIPYKLGMLSEVVAFSMTINLETVLISAFTLIFISLVICAFPVHRALKMNITEALRDL